MSVDVSTFVWLTSRQKNSALLMMLALADFANENGQCWPGLPELARRVRTTVRNAQLILRKLEDDKAIAIDTNGGCDTPTGKTNRYTIAGFVDWFKEVKKISPHSKPKGVKRTSPPKKQGVKFSATEGVKFLSPDPSYDPSSKDIPNGISATADAIAQTSENPQPINPEIKRESIEAGKLYLHLDGNRYQGPYAPYGNFVKQNGGMYLAGEKLPPDAVIVPLAKAPKEHKPPDAIFKWVCDYLKVDAEVAWTSKRHLAHVLTGYIVREEKHRLRLDTKTALNDEQRTACAVRLPGFIPWYQRECKDCPTPTNPQKFETWIGKWFKAGATGNPDDGKWTFDPDNREWRPPQNAK